MTSLEFLALLESGREAPGTVCRDPEGRVYLIAPPGAEGRYVLEGFIAFGKGSHWRERLHAGTLNAVGAGLPTWLLRMDIEQMNAEGKEKGR